MTILALTPNDEESLDTTGDQSNASQMPLLLGGGLSTTGGSQGLEVNVVATLLLTPNS